LQRTNGRFGASFGSSTSKPFGPSPIPVIKKMSQRTVGIKRGAQVPNEVETLLASDFSNHFDIMMHTSLFSVVAALASAASAVSVSGAAEGFAKGVTGGGSATAVYPSTNAELVSYLGDSSARVIVLQKTFDFTGTTTTSTGCAPWGTASACQLAINQNDWCTNYEPDAPTVSVTYDTAGVEGITVNSDKTILGSGSSGIIKGKGLRMANGVSNIIIQNIKITDLNPKYVWGGDARKFSLI
jgi:pectin lyase